jgi:NADPH:quinone reductase-like Zn-dependent oxidoreductase
LYHKAIFCESRIVRYSVSLTSECQSTSINPVDWKIKKGSLWFFSGWKFPQLLGADFAGKVETIGQRVTSFQVGDEVYGFINPLMGGTYAEYVVVPDSCAEIKPKNITFQDAPLPKLPNIILL